MSIGEAEIAYHLTYIAYKMILFWLCRADGSVAQWRAGRRGPRAGRGPRRGGGRRAGAPPGAGTAAAGQLRRVTRLRRRTHDTVSLPPHYLI